MASGAAAAQASSERRVRTNERFIGVGLFCRVREARTIGAENSLPIGRRCERARRTARSS
jgi:hypothetical protein